MCATVAKWLNNEQLLAIHEYNIILNTYLGFHRTNA